MHIDKAGYMAQIEIDSFFTNGGVPDGNINVVSGNTYPQIRVWQTVGTAFTLIVGSPNGTGQNTNGFMTNDGQTDGFYSFLFTDAIGFDPSVKYVMRVDGGPSLASAERYQTATIDPVTLTPTDIADVENANINTACDTTANTLYAEASNLLNLVTNLLNNQTIKKKVDADGNAISCVTTSAVNVSEIIPISPVSTSTTVCGETVCTGEAGPFTVDGNSTTTNNSSLILDPTCPPLPIDVASLKQWQLSNSNDACIINSYVNEALIIAGASFNVYALLGTHNQGKLVDVTGKGTPISNGDLPGFPATYAFDMYKTEWRSLQTGLNVPSAAYIGYDFGEIKSTNGLRNMYGIETKIRKHITTIGIKQSSTANNRVTVARVERSEDNVEWYGVGIIQLPDNDCLNLIYLRDSVPSRYWRLRPITFNGTTCDYWGIQAFQMFHNYTATQSSNIQDKILVENRDRAYCTEPVVLKGSYDLLDVNSELTKMGIELPSQILIVQMNFLGVIAVLGRPLVIGDIVEVPNEAQYSSDLRRIRKWLEVSDVSWSTQGYTPGWHPTMIAVTMQPAIVSEETQDIFGDLAAKPIPNELGLLDRNQAYDKFFQDYFDMSQTATALAKDEVPEKGAEGSGRIRKWTKQELDNASAQGLHQLRKTGLAPKSLYVEDAMPPNNTPYTQGTTFPTSPIDGQYFRVVYTGLSENIPARLYRYSTSKGQWVFLEVDKRALNNPTKPVLQEFLTSPTAVPTNKVTKGV